MKKKLFSLLLILSLTVSMTCGCGEKEKAPVSANEPITIHMSYGAGMDQNNANILIDLINKYNESEGPKTGITVTVSNGFESDDTKGSEDLQKVIKGTPDAPSLPDIMVISTQNAVPLYKKGLLQPYDFYFSDDELSKYFNWYIEEGRFDDGGLYVFPFVKSSECLFVNRTLFDPFAEENGYTLDDLDTFENIYLIGKKYNRWTNTKTSTTPNDGKAFFAADSWFNLFLTGVWQFDEPWFNDDDTLNEDSASACYIRRFLLNAAEQGIFLTDGGYSSAYMNTGDIVCCIGSSAGSFYYNDTFTNEDGETLPLDLTVLPYPHFKNGEYIAISRGEGIILAKSDKKHEYAASEVVKWLTSTEQNLTYVAKTGYAPVTREGEAMSVKTAFAKNIENPRLSQLYEITMEMLNQYEFVFHNGIEGYESTKAEFEDRFMQEAHDVRKKFLSLPCWN